jgi:signal transduction histidine kinase
MFIDVRTTYLLVGLLYIVLPLTVFFLLKDYKKNTVTLWCVGGLVAGCGMVFLGLRPFLEGKFPGFITYTLGNLLLVMGYTMRAQSMRIDIGKPFSHKWLFVSVLLFVILYELARSDWGSVAVRIGYAYLWVAGILFILVRATYDYEKKTAIKQIRFIWITYLLLALSIVSRATLILLGMEEAIILKNSISNSLIVLFGVVTVIYSNVAYVGMMLAKVEKESAVATRKNTKLLTALNRQSNIIKDLMRVQSLSVVGTYGSAVVHEVLQPLTAMRFALENLKMHVLRMAEDKTTQERINAVDSSAARVVAVIENLRNFIVEREVKIEPVSLNKIMREVAEITASRAKNLGVEITLKMEGDISVMADEHQLQRVLFNILNNALDAIERHAGSSVSHHVLINAKWVQQKHFVLIKVIDSGVGLQAKDQVEIFEWLSANSNKGMGIGLALSKMLVESWRGHISAYNADPKVDGLSGAVFELKLQSA